MHIFTDVNDPQVSSLLVSGGVGVLRTDTLYGIVCQANNRAAVKRLYNLKDRDERKSPIVLISSTDDLFDVPSEQVHQSLENIWPGPVSVILPSQNAPQWLRRQNKSIAYRLPANDALVSLLKVTGPLIAPSANPEGQPPAMNLAQTQAYFGERVDFYVDGGDVTSTLPSKILRLLPDGEVERLR